MLAAVEGLGEARRGALVGGKEMTEIEKVEKAIADLIKHRRNLVTALNTVPETPGAIAGIRDVQENIELMHQVLEHEKKLYIPEYKIPVAS